MNAPVFILAGTAGIIIGMEIRSRRWHRMMDTRIAYYNDRLEADLAEMQRIAPFIHAAFVHIRKHYPVDAMERLLEHPGLREYAEDLESGRTTGTFADLIDVVDRLAERLQIPKKGDRP